MSPRLATLLALAGVLLAGIPLPALTGKRAATADSTPAAPRPVEGTPCFMSLRFTGQPQQITVLHEGRELARLHRNAPSEPLTSPWEADILLPTIREGRTLELEVQALWPPDSAEEQAVTLTLEPTRHPTRSDTRWALGGTLHDLFTFSW